MKRELLSRALGEIDESFIAEAYRPAEQTAGSSERVVHRKRKRIVTFALAAALLLALSVAAYAVNQAVGTPQAAERVARQEIEVWKRLGLLNPELAFEGSAARIVEIPESTGDKRWYGRLFSHSYDVRWYLSRDGAKYGCNLTIDTLSGKIRAATIDARADEDAIPVRQSEWEIPADPGNPDGEQQMMPIYFYDNFEDIFPADMTVDRFCTLLASYWDFTGYRLAETVDEEYFDEPQPPAAPDSLLKELNADKPANYYLTVFFEGDQPGAPRYIQLNQFPGYVSLMVGTGHAVG